MTLLKETPLQAERIFHLSNMRKLGNFCPVGNDTNAEKATRDGPALAKAFTAIEDGKLRRCIVNLVEEIAKGG